MELHLARNFIAMLNFLVGISLTGYIILLGQSQWSRDEGSGTVGVVTALGVVLATALASILCAALLTARRTMYAGLKLHFALANFTLFLAFWSLLVAAWGRPDHSLRPLELYGAYWTAGCSGLWFALGLMVKALMRVENAKLNPEARQWLMGRTAEEVTTAAPCRLSLLASLPAPAEHPVPVMLGNRR